MMLNMGVHLIPAIMIRSLVVMMHAITTYIQYHARKNSVNKDETSKIALLFAITIHFFWNLGAVSLSPSGQELNKLFSRDTIKIGL